MRNSTLVTPSASTDLLEGITRDSVIRIARDAGIPIVERAVDRSELYIADEAFICGSSARITPILSVDKRTIAAGTVGSVTATLLQKYQEIQNGIGSESYRDWLTEI